MQAVEHRHLHNALSLWKRVTDKNLNDLVSHLLLTRHMMYPLWRLGCEGSYVADDYVDLRHRSVLQCLMHSRSIPLSHCLRSKAGSERQRVLRQSCCLRAERIVIWCLVQEERQEQLKAVTELAAIIAGFEMIAFLQFQFNTIQIADGLQLAYVATSGLTVPSLPHAS